MYIIGSITHISQTWRLGASGREPHEKFVPRYAFSTRLNVVL